jgi:hypothetical protein
MKLVLEVKDNKVDYILQLLKQYSFVKVKPIVDKKAAKQEFLKDLEASVEEVKLIRAGKKEGTLLSDFLKEV